MPKDYLPVSTIPSYFSRRAKKVRSSEINILESENKLVGDDEGMVEDSGIVEMIMMKLMSTFNLLSNKSMKGQ